MGLQIKRNPSDEIVKFKIRLFAKGFTQRPVIDYTETFAPVAHTESINVVLSITANEVLEAKNVDVDIAFRIAKLTKRFKWINPMDSMTKNTTKKCLLQKTLYGTKQATRQ